MDTLVRDVVIVGAGAAGLNAAAECAAQGLSTIVLDKGIIGNDCATVSAKGLAAVGRWSKPGDGPEAQIEDTLKAGCYINDPDLVELFVRQGESALLELERRGMPFDKNPDGSMAIHGGGEGHSFQRMLGFSDITGKMMIDSLVAHARRSRMIDLMRDTLAVGLIPATGADGVAGVLALNLPQGEFVFLRCKSIIIATGGIGQLYPVTSNCLQNTGDGIGIALMAGLTCRDMEFVQFYPATVVYPLPLRCMNANSIGLGAQLKNAQGVRFMEKYEPEKLERVTRDRLAQCIYKEITEGRGTEHGGVYLDATMVPAEVYSTRVPSEWNLCRAAGVDLTREPLEVAPAAHYFMGGIKIDITAKTAVDGVFAAGECTAGVNGANRLTGNSLTEVLVVGKIAGQAAARHASSAKFLPWDGRELERRLSWATRHLTAPANAPTPREVRSALQKLMWECVGIVRNESGLNRALDGIKSLVSEVRSGMYCVSAKGKSPRVGPMNTQLLMAIENDFMLVVAQAIAQSALMRTESRGAHFREDYPVQDPSWLANIDVIYDEESEQFTLEVLQRGPAGGGVR